MHAVNDLAIVCFVSLISVSLATTPTTTKKDDVKSTSTSTTTTTTTAAAAAAATKAATPSPETTTKATPIVTPQCEKTELYAVCRLQANPNNPSDIKGTLYFRHDVLSCRYSFLNIQVKIDNVPKDDGTNLHGLHIHQYGDMMTNGCSSLGGHYNPQNVTHGAPQDLIRHVGALGNVRQRPDGSINQRLVDYKAKLYGNETIIGRGIVLHAGKDDLGRGGNAGSLATGNAGGRLACCTIAHSAPFSSDVFTLY